MKKLLLLAYTLFVTTTLFAQSAFYVDSSNTSPTKNGLSWVTAYTSVAQAVNNSSSGDTIYIAKGTYKEGSVVNITHHLTLKGGYPSGGGLTQSNTHKTIIDGNNTHRVIFVTISNLTVLLDHINIQNGQVSSASNQYASGLRTVIGCTIKMTSCNVIDNSATSVNSIVLGGGIYFGSNNDITMINCRVTGNTINSNGGVTGAAIYCAGGTFRVVNSLIAQNTSNGSMSISGTAGIEIATITDTCRIINSLICDNQTNSGGGSASAIKFPNGSHNLFLITNSIIAGNSLNGNLMLPINATSLPQIRYSYLQGSAVTTNGNLDATTYYPHFIDSINGDYRLNSYSPLINAGNNIVLPLDTLDIDKDGNVSEGLPIDFEGNNRITYNTIDIGPYEFQTPSITNPTALYVDSSNTNVLQNGYSWATAFPTLTAAVNASTANDTIYIAKGTYQSGSTTNITHNLILRGGYPRGGGTIQDTANSAIIDGNNSYRVFSLNGVTAHFEYLQIQRGFVSGAFSIGGGISLQNTTLHLLKTKLSGNQATYGGGIGTATTGTSTLSLSDCVMVSNDAQDGGGIYLQNASLAINNSFFDDNTATVSGGAVSTYSNTSFQINNSRFTNNSTGTNNYCKGGAINANGGSSSSTSFIIVNSVIDSNSSYLGAGVSVINTSSLKMVNCMLRHNTALYGGGGITSEWNLSLVNCLVSKNASTNSNAVGGGIYSSGVLELVNTTVAGNAASIGGGIYRLNNSSYTLTNSIVANNSAATSLPQGNIYASSYSYIQGINATGTGNKNGILLSPMFIDTISGDYHLQTNSPLINAGSTGALPTDSYDLDNDANTIEILPVDLDNAARMYGCAVEMGPYETVYALPTYATINDTTVCESGIPIRIVGEGMSLLKWYSDATLNTQIGTGDTLNTGISNGGIYTFYVTDSAFGCIPLVIDTVILTIYQKDTTIIAQSVCDSFVWASNNITYTSSGIYYDTLTNSNGCDSILKLDLTIHEKATILTQPLSYVSECEGGNILLSVQASNAAGYQWYKNNMLLTDGGTVSGSLTNQLLITDVSSQDAGNYFAIVQSANNTCNDDTSTVALVTINNLSTVLASDNTSDTISLEDGVSNTFSDALCNPIAMITDSANGASLGNVSVVVNVDASVSNVNGQPYLQRHYEITALNDDTATLVLYATQAEFNAYNLAAGTYPLLPSSASSPDTANVHITQYKGTPFAAPSQLITPTSVVWNNVKVRWEITFNVDGFSSFYIHTGIHPLTITLSELRATNIGNSNRIDWTTANEENADRFVVEKSNDAKNFKKAGEVAAIGKPASYTFMDKNLFTGINYYRLKMTDKNGTFRYSAIVSANLAGESHFSVKAYPNPLMHGDRLIVEISGIKDDNARLIITDITGKILKTIGMTENKTTIDFSSFTNGLYFIKYIDHTHTEVIKLNKN